MIPRPQWAGPHRFGASITNASAALSAMMDPSDFVKGFAANVALYAEVVGFPVVGIGGGLQVVEGHAEEGRRAGSDVDNFFAEKLSKHDVIFWFLLQSINIKGN